MLINFSRIKFENMFIKQRSFWLLAITAIISGGGWILLPSQIQTVPKEFSIAYRFILASLVLGSIAWIRGEKLFDKNIIKRVIFQGIIMYPLTYFLTYSACHHIPSGLVGLISSMIIIPTYVIGLIDREYTLSIAMAVIILSSCAGLSLVFHQDIVMPSHNLLGLTLAISSAIASALGYALIRKISLNTDLSTLAIAIATLSTGVGGIASMIYAMSIHQEIAFSYQPNYLISLLVLGVVLTPFVFVSLYHLASNFSTLHTSYVFALAPIFSVVLSYAFENYNPDIWNILGVFAVIFSCLLAKKKVAELKKHNGKSI